MLQVSSMSSTLKTLGRYSGNVGRPYWLSQVQLRIRIWKKVSTSAKQLYPSSPIPAPSDVRDRMIVSIRLNIELSLRLVTIFSGSTPVPSLVTSTPSLDSLGAWICPRRYRVLRELSDKRSSAYSSNKYTLGCIMTSPGERSANTEFKCSVCNRGERRSARRSWTGQMSGLKWKRSRCTRLSYAGDHNGILAEFSNIFSTERSHSVRPNRLRKFAVAFVLSGRTLRFSNCVENHFDSRGWESRIKISPFQVNLTIRIRVLLLTDMKGSEIT